MDVIFFVYGLSFFAMALVILVQPKVESQHGLARFIWLLVIFGFVHGMLEWMDLWTTVRGGNLTLEIWKVSFLFISFGFLFEFGRRLILTTTSSNFARKLAGKLIYSVVVLGFLIELLIIPDWMLATKIASRYFLGFAGSTMAGAGFLLYFYKNIDQHMGSAELSWTKKYFILAAIAFSLYGVMGGLVVPTAEVFPANVINQQSFLSTFQIPVQLFRAACAVLAAISVGNILRIFDAEARKRLQTSLALVNKRTQQLLDAQEKLVRKEKLAVLGQVAGSVGHELRNPLGVMSNAVYFLQTVLTNKDEEIKEYLGIIKDEITTSERIVSNLLDSVHTKPPQPETVSVMQLIEQTLGNLTIPPSVNVKLNIPATLPLLLVDVMQIHQVFHNLICNSVEAMPEGGALEIQAITAKKNITISVRDTGIGITPELQSKLFQPLFTTKARGIGLGLVVVKNLTEANGGRIEVQSEVEKGTTFFITFPCNNSGVGTA